MGEATRRGRLCSFRTVGPITLSTILVKLTWLKLLNILKTSQSNSYLSSADSPPEAHDPRCCPLHTQQCFKGLNHIGVAVCSLLASMKGVRERPEGNKGAWLFPLAFLEWPPILSNPWVRLSFLHNAIHNRSQINLARAPQYGINQRHSPGGRLHPFPMHAWGIDTYTVLLW